MHLLKGDNVVTPKIILSFGAPPSPLPVENHPEGLVTKGIILASDKRQAK